MNKYKRNKLISKWSLQSEEDLWDSLKDCKKNTLKSITYYLLCKYNKRNQILNSGKIPIVKTSKRRANPMVKKRDNNRCRLCLRNEDLQVHHITPKFMGGQDSFDNLITLCSRCHHFLHYCNPMTKFGHHAELTKAGLVRAKRNGKTLGRPSKDK